jgi:hypothetical protein
LGGHRSYSKNGVWDKRKERCNDTLLVCIGVMYNRANAQVAENRREH